MMLQEIRCPQCHALDKTKHMQYQVKSGEIRFIYACKGCHNHFSETKNTPLAGLRTNMDTIIKIMKSLNEGMSINATCRTFEVSRNTVRNWLDKLGSLKKTLLLYAQCQKFVSQIIEGDELYTKVYKNTPQDESQGWTIVLMERASRFIWHLKCGEKDHYLFMDAMGVVAQVIETTQKLSLFTDGERRYGNMLFEICHEVIRTGKRGRPAKTLVENVIVRVKNKGSQAHKKGPKREKYQAPQPEHPATTLATENHAIHANHLEAFNSALRRKLSCYRRRTNTYAKNTERLQARLNVQWIFHNFICKHFTTKKVPAVALGIVEKSFSIAQMFRMQVLSTAHP
ncbi:MAG: IS1 family transposase [Mariprofundaceae bacterium]|nr:IS1 family transposase [Mariprofundaceae bacterium]